jgi:TolA-binding protein
MKKFFVTLCLFAVASTAMFAQTTKPDEQLTKDEAVIKINEFTLKVQELTNTLNTLDQDIANLRSELDNVIAQLKDCNKSLNELIGANEADVAAFAQKLGNLEGRVRSMKNLSNDVLAEKVNEVKALEEEWNQLKNNKISILPQFYDRMVTLHRDIKGLYRTPSTKSYTVGTWAENRDCLWNIAGNIEIYGDPFMWPKIWQANTEIIRNPDIIFPGQVLKVPTKNPKTDDEIKAERKYWRKKHAAVKAAQEVKANESANEKGAQKGN